MIPPVLASILPGAGRDDMLLLVPYAVLRHVSSPNSQLQPKQREHYQIVPIVFTCPHAERIDEPEHTLPAYGFLLNRTT
jgi:hypothetical protein